ncbi:hypothetical protein Pmani_001203 [Petrolisthes manimaculis]|uniref:procollagen-proline 4-dioxygenase n=1 Tax=Petrolisthes manimaculis TaxID=1843537 RepID=A0AAE1Q229_9EUCA|nr:hypothetical protein Pmani_010746 [Petrolisthes manimaculis]KAK4328375.1 hypothetical protein Pmani_001203 [Petrolisthes manimaculis]
MLQHHGRVWVAWLGLLCMGVLSQNDHINKPSDLYSSLLRMKVVFKFDEAVGELVSSWPKSSPPAEAIRYLESYQSVVLDRARDGGIEEGVSGNPLHLYSVIKRLVRLWPFLKPHLEALQHDQQEGVVVVEAVRLVLQAENNTVLPDEADLTGATIALARLQHIYNIPVADLMKGKLTATHTPSSISLSIEDCVDITETLYNHWLLPLAWQWASSCIKATTNHQLQLSIQQLMDNIEQKHDQSWTANSNIFLPQPLNISKNQVPRQSTYTYYCRGLHQKAQHSLLRCHVGNRGSHYLTLQPVRYEELHHDPDLTIFYDVISDAEIEQLKGIASQMLKRSCVGTGTGQPDETRVSQTAWVPNNTSHVLPIINRRIDAITNLFVYEGDLYNRAAEVLQMVNYGIGGHFTLHHDDFDEQPGDKAAGSNGEYDWLGGGNRLATWMFYLSDVVAGGSTVFPTLRLSITPVKGSAAFWYNLKRNGDRDPKLLHGGCPVLLGQKWVANKWIREHKNFLRYPCSTHPNQ